MYKTVRGDPPGSSTVPTQCLRLALRLTMQDVRQWERMAALGVRGCQYSSVMVWLYCNPMLHLLDNLESMLRYMLHIVLVCHNFLCQTIRHPTIRMAGHGAAETIGNASATSLAAGVSWFCRSNSNSKCSNSNNNNNSSSNSSTNSSSSNNNDNDDSSTGRATGRVVGLRGRAFAKIVYVAPPQAEETSRTRLSMWRHPPGEPQCGKKKIPVLPPTSVTAPPQGGCSACCRGRQEMFSDALRIAKKAPLRKAFSSTSLWVRSICFAALERPG